MPAPQGSRARVRFYANALPDTAQVFQESELARWGESCKNISMVNCGCNSIVIVIVVAIAIVIVIVVIVVVIVTIAIVIVIVVVVVIAIVIIIVVIVNCGCNSIVIVIVVARSLFSTFSSRVDVTKQVKQRKMLVRLLVRCVNTRLNNKCAST